NFAAGGIATPADVALVMQLGSEGVFVGSGIFKSSNPLKLAKAIVQATTYYNKPDKLAKVSFNLGKSMKGNEISKLKEKYAERGI
ncbi:MAG: pyridoxal 5'-phosphate synthase lyase subunit PdxS, partial [Candidatus Diapherotrites archaeon]